MFEKLKNLKLFQNSKFKIQNFWALGLYLLIFLLPFQTHLVLRTGEWHGKFGGSWPVDYWRIALYGTDILLAILLTGVAVIALRSKQEPSKMGGIWLSIGALDLALLLSIFFATDKTLAIYKYVSFLLGVGLLWLLSLDFYDKAKATVALLSSVLIQSLLSIGQFLYQGAFGSKWLGMAAHTAADGGASVVETIGADGQIERWLRAYGSFDHPNILGGFLAIGFIISFYSLLRHKRGRTGTDKKFILSLSSFVVILVGLMFTFSRTAMAAAAVGCLVMAIPAFYRRDKAAMLRVVKIAVLSAAVSFLAIFSYADVFMTRTSYQAKLEARSVSERKVYWDDAVRSIKQSKLLGVGLGNYTKELEANEPERFFWQWQPVHNVLMLALAEVGIFGFLAFLGFFTTLIWLSLKKKDAFGLSISLSLGIMMILDHYLWSLHSGQMIFWLAAGLVMANLSNNKGNDNQSTKEIPTRPLQSESSEKG